MPRPASIVPGETIGPERMTTKALIIGLPQCRDDGPTRLGWSMAFAVRK